MTESLPDPEDFSFPDGEESMLPSPPALPAEDSAILRQAAQGVERLQALLEEDEREGTESPIDTMLRLLEEMLATQKLLVDGQQLLRTEMASISARLPGSGSNSGDVSGVPSDDSSTPPVTSGSSPSGTSGVH
jgi:hypothetical protein